MDPMWILFVTEQKLAYETEVAWYSDGSKDVCRGNTDSGDASDWGAFLEWESTFRRHANDLRWGLGSVSGDFLLTYCTESADALRYRKSGVWKPSPSTFSLEPSSLGSQGALVSLCPFSSDGFLIWKSTRINYTFSSDWVAAFSMNSCSRRSSNTSILRIQLNPFSHHSS